MIEHNKNFYSLEELKRTRDNLKGYLDNEEVYYFVGAIRYACDEIERLNELVKGLREERDYLFNKTTTESNYEIERLNNIINELEKDIKNLYTYGIKNNAEQRDYLLNRLEGLQELKGSDK